MGAINKSIAEYPSFKLSKYTPPALTSVDGPWQFNLWNDICIFRQSFTVSTHFHSSYAGTKRRPRNSVGTCLMATRRNWNLLTSFSFQRLFFFKKNCFIVLQCNLHAPWLKNTIFESSKYIAKSNPSVSNYDHSLFFAVSFWAQRIIWILFLLS